MDVNHSQQAYVHYITFIICSIHVGKENIEHRNVEQQLLIITAIIIPSHIAFGFRIIPHIISCCLVFVANGIIDYNSLFNHYNSEDRTRSRSVDLSNTERAAYHQVYILHSTLTDRASSLWIKVYHTTTWRGRKNLSTQESLQRSLWL